MRPISRPASSNRRGFTLVEMMVSVTLALLMILAVVQVFQWMGDSVAYGRATIEMSSELQTATSQLQRDLDNRTCDVKPWVKSGEGGGYFYYREGPLSDLSSLDVGPGSPDGVVDAGDLDANRTNFFSANSPVGDNDDWLALTVRSTGKPFTGWDGATPPNLVESSMAEVIYVVATVNGARNLYRKVRLIRPDYGTFATGTPNRWGDIAVGTVSGVTGTGQTTALSLSQLTDLNATVQVEPSVETDNTLPTFGQPLFGTAHGNRVYHLWTVAQIAVPANMILQDVLAFDVRAFDPDAPIYGVDGVALSPGDPGYIDLAGGTAIGSGAFVDLGHIYDFTPLYESNPIAMRRRTGGGQVDPNSFAGGVFYSVPNGVDLTDASTGVASYNTMPWTAVMNTVATDGLDSPDIGDADGDNNTTETINGIDDPGERTVFAPYEAPLRGIEVTLRMWEVQTGQVMQSSVVGDFVPK